MRIHNPFILTDAYASHEDFVNLTMQREIASKQYHDRMWDKGVYLRRSIESLRKAETHSDDATVSSALDSAAYCAMDARNAHNDAMSAAKNIEKIDDEIDLLTGKTVYLPQKMRLVVARDFVVAALGNDVWYDRKTDVERGNVKSKIATVKWLRENFLDDAMPSHLAVREYFWHGVE